MFVMPLLVSLASLWKLVTASPQSSTPTASQSGPVPTICGDLISFVDENPSTNLLFSAVDVFDCLTSVPFLDAVAYRYIDYFNTTIQFQSTLAYLRNPPIGYQQPAIDVLAALEQIKYNVTAGYYKNQYDFEATLQSLVVRMHDTHVTLDAGILSAFSFGSPYDIISLSTDGKQIPQIYLVRDIVESQQEGWTPSPIQLINGVNTAEYLMNFASLNSRGSLEANTDWNQLFYSPVQEILEAGNVFGWHTTFYPGNELEFTFANQSTTSTIWIALYKNGQSTGPLTTGGDFYNYFVLGLLPASYVDSNDDNNTTNMGDDYASLTSWNDVSAAYPPDPFVVQADLGGTGYVTGYFLNGSTTAVLSIPTFNAFGDISKAFSEAVGEFVQYAKGNGTSRVVIDLQQNTGGATLLAYDTFHHFFPNIVPFGGSRRRSFPLGDTLGNTITNYWDMLYGDPKSHDLYSFLADDEWVITDRLNADTGQNFTSWQQYFGPIRFQDDTFSLTERYNLSSDIFVSAALEGPVFVGSNTRNPNAAPPWQPSEIVLLTDGLCGSTCALFAEMMTHSAGVRTVVVGGTPSVGPMQAVGGSRGARSYTANALDTSFKRASTVNSTAQMSLPPNQKQAIATNYFSFNLRDQIRQGESIPLQFQYEPADCRIYYTVSNAFNLTQLWTDAARAAFEDPLLCVPGSTRQGGSNDSTNGRPQAPSYDNGSGGFSGITTNLQPNGDHGPHDVGLASGGAERPGGFYIPASDTRCASNYRPTSLPCPQGDIALCAPRCVSNERCDGVVSGVCDTPPLNRNSRLNMPVQGKSDFSLQRAISKAFCKPQTYEACFENDMYNLFFINQRA